MSRAKIVIPSVQVEAEETLVIVTPPRDLTKTERNTVIACLISTLRTKPADYLTTVTLVYNIMQLSLAGLKDLSPDIRSMDVQLQDYTKQEILDWAGLGEEEARGSARIPFLLPGPVAEDAKAVTSSTAVYVGVASILFAMGRQASESAATATLEKRPDALIRRFSIEDEDKILLPGREAGPSRESLEHVYNAFSVYTALRGEVVRYLIGLQRSELHFPLSMEIVLTNFSLMRGAGMTHVDAILRLAKMHPWTLKVPELEPYWDRFAHDLVEFNKVESDVRPYHRLLVPQASFLFLSSGLTPLIAVAGSFIKDVEKTFANYVYRADQYVELVEHVRRYAPGYKPTHQVNTLAALLGVQDVPLPPYTPADIATPASASVV